jgi:hypothetical protein
LRRGVEAADWCEGVRSHATARRLTRTSWHAGWRSVVGSSVRWAVGASEDGGRRYRPQRAADRRRARRARRLIIKSQIRQPSERIFVLSRVMLDSCVSADA